MNLGHLDDWYETPMLFCKTSTKEHFLGTIGQLVAKIQLEHLTKIYNPNAGNVHTGDYVLDELKKWEVKAKEITPAMEILYGKKEQKELDKD